MITSEHMLTCRRYNGYLYDEIDPAIFRVGHVVQLQVSFAAVPKWGGTGKHQMACKLRSIAVLDTQVQEVSLRTALSETCNSQIDRPMNLA